MLNFETKCLDLPAGQADAEDHLIPDVSSLQSLKTADSEMGKDLDDLFNILYTDAREDLSDAHIITDHRWNAKKAHFEKWACINVPPYRIYSSYAIGSLAYYH